MRAGSSVVGAFAVAALVAVLGLAVVERWEEPASSPVIGAEDPYTHMVFVREHVANGGFAPESDRIGVGLYPPGMHAMMGILWVDAGADLYELARWFPIVFGVVAAWGTFALLSRHGPGPVGGLVGAALAAFVVATNPEHVVRSDLLFPTAMDLALLPWIFLGIADALKGDRRGLVVAGILSVALVLAHPWIGFVIAGAGVFAAGAMLLLSPHGEGKPTDATVTGVTLAAIALFAAQYQGQFDGDKGFATAGYLASGLSLLAAVAFLAFRAAPLGRLRGLKATRIAAAALVGVAVAGAYGAVMSAEDLPLHVNYGRMLGFPLLALVSVGAVAVALRPSAAGLLGLGTCAVTFPFTAFDLLDSWYLPHRTMVYLVAGAALVGGHAAGALVERLATSRLATTRRAAPLAVAAVVLVAGVGTVAAGTPDAYVWDRYVTDEEFAAIHRLASRMDADPAVHVITTSWVVNVMLGALCENDGSHFRDGFFKSAEKRDQELAKFAKEGWTPVVVVDAHTLDIAERKGLDLSFLDREWIVLDQGGHVTVYGRP